jgi:hypothetical protein
MKGTLFSADFVTTPQGDVKMLELNTDTAFTDSALNYFNFNLFNELLDSSSLTEVHVIYKSFQENFVNALSQSISLNSNITTFETTLETDYTIYPTDVVDSDTKFILRCAYNESAIFDSQYCASNVELYNLLGASMVTGSMVGYYFSSSVDTIDTVNKLDYVLNDGNDVPDFIIKTLNLSGGDIAHEKEGFYKLGHSSASVEDRINDFINEMSDDGILISNYYNTSEGTQKNKAIRSANILYGSNLDNINLYTKKVDTLLEKPNVEDIIIDDSKLYTKYPLKHLYEFATNTFKFNILNQDGISGYDVLTSGSEQVLISESIQGNTYSSIRISGTPNSDNLSDILAWSNSGNTLPGESFVTSSVLVSKTATNVEYGVLQELLFTSGSWSGSIVTGNALPVLVYDSSDNTTRYKLVGNIEPGVDMAFKADGGLVDISENNYIVLGEYPSYTYTLDFEDDDTFLVNEAGVRLISHNIKYAPTPPAGIYSPTCFPAGTQITLSNGDVKNIEDVVEGDLVSTIDVTTMKEVENKVLFADSRHVAGDHKDSCNILGHDKTGLFSISLETENGIEENVVSFTPEHPIYTKRGWAALHALTTQEPWISEQTETLKLEINDEIFYKNSWCKISDITYNECEDTLPVYNLTIENTHTYFANDVLVHNK